MAETRPPCRPVAASVHDVARIDIPIARVCGWWAARLSGRGGCDCRRRCVFKWRTGLAVASARRHCQRLCNGQLRHRLEVGIRPLQPLERLFAVCTFMPWVTVAVISSGHAGHEGQRVASALVTKGTMTKQAWLAAPGLCTAAAYQP